MAKSKFPVRIVDGLGRIVLPKAIREQLNLEEGAQLEIYLDPQGKIVLERATPKVKYRKKLLT